MHNISWKHFRLSGFLFRCLLVAILALMVLVKIAYARDARPFAITNFRDLGLRVHIPAYPKWKADVYDSATSPMIEIRTPENYYPPTVMQIVKHSNYKASKQGLRDVALSAMNTIRMNSNAERLGSEAEIRSYASGEIAGFEDNYHSVTENEKYEFRSIVAVLPSGSLLTVLIATPAEQLSHIEHMVEKMMANLKEI